ncbi:MAG: hypothetical protein ACPIOQ_26975, partial [Promethearchaeia archaeon]
GYNIIKKRRQHRKATFKVDSRFFRSKLTHFGWHAWGTGTDQDRFGPHDAAEFGLRAGCCSSSLRLGRRPT